MISSSQRPLPDNTRHSQQTNIHAPGGIRTQDLSRRAATVQNRHISFMFHFHMTLPSRSQFVTSAAMRISLTAAVDVLFIALPYNTHSRLVSRHILNLHLSTTFVTCPMAFRRTLNTKVHKLHFTSPYPTEVLWMTQE